MHLNDQDVPLLIVRVTVLVLPCMSLNDPVIVAEFGFSENGIVTNPEELLTVATLVLLEDHVMLFMKLEGLLV